MACRITDAWWWQRVVVRLEPPALAEGLALRYLIDWPWMFFAICKLQ